MAKVGYAMLISVLVIVIAMLAGCAKEPAQPVAVVEEEVVEEVEVPALDPAAEPAAEPVTEPAADAAAEADTDASKVTAALASLSEADRAAAIAQKVCPVSDEALGSMGTPLKVAVAGREVFICCENCRDPLVAEPEKYLAKLDAAKTP